MSQQVIVRALRDLSAFVTPPSILVAGVDIAVTVAAGALPTATCRAVLLVADQTNTVNLLVGDATRQTVPILAGNSLTIPIDSSGKVFVVAAAAGISILHWMYVAS